MLDYPKPEVEQATAPLLKKRWKPKTLLQAMCTGAAVRTPRWSQRGKRRKLMPPPQRGVQGTMRSFRCPECPTGTVAMRPATAADSYFWRGKSWPVPAGTFVPKCHQCGETYFAARDFERVERALIERYGAEP